MESESYRSANYSLQDYIHEWNHKTAAIKTAVQKACPERFSGFMAPSFIALSPEVLETSSHSGDVIPSKWTVEELFASGYDDRNLTRNISIHK